MDKFFPKLAFFKCYELTHPLAILCQLVSSATVVKIKLHEAKTSCSGSSNQQ